MPARLHVDASATGAQQQARALPVERLGRDLRSGQERRERTAHHGLPDGNRRQQRLERPELLAIDHEIDGGAPSRLRRTTRGARRLHGAIERQDERAPDLLRAPDAGQIARGEGVVRLHERLLEAEGGNVLAAARTAGMDRVYLYRLLRKHGLR